jgi:hypothetical protein
MMIAATPFEKPNGEMNVPVSISAMDTDAPNHNNPWLEMGSL